MPSERAADKIVDMMLDQVLSASPLFAADTNVGREKQVAVMINNLGATTSLELYVVARRVISSLRFVVLQQYIRYCIKYANSNYLERINFLLPFYRERGVSVCRAYVGSFMTALNMSGVSVSVLAIPTDLLLEYLDVSTSAPAWTPSADLLADYQTHNDGSNINKDGEINSSLSSVEEVCAGPACLEFIPVLTAICERIMCVLDSHLTLKI
jgi:hypothetical protein